MQIAKWGNSLAVRLPAALVRELGLKEGDEISLSPGPDGMIVQRQPGAEQVLAELRALRGALPAAKRLSREAANERA